jgi:threonine 3-dehydrogenase
MGADTAVNPIETDLLKLIHEHTNGYGVDVIIEASGNVAALKQAFKLLRKGGMVALIGLPGQPVEFEIGKDIVFKEAQVIGIHGRKMFSTWARIERLLSTGKLNVSPAISHIFPLDNWQEGVHLAETGQGCKIILQP